MAHTQGDVNTQCDVKSRHNGNVQHEEAMHKAMWPGAHDWQYMQQTVALVASYAAL